MNLTENPIAEISYLTREHREEFDRMFEKIRGSMRGSIEEQRLFRQLIFGLIDAHNLKGKLESRPETFFQIFHPQCLPFFTRIEAFMGMKALDNDSAEFDTAESLTCRLAAIFILAYILEEMYKVKQNGRAYP